MIDYQTDWLYALVFAHADGSWHMCCGSVSKVHWQYLLISEWSSAEDAHCRGEIVRAWVRNDDGLKEISLDQYEQHSKRISGPLFPFIFIRFHISSNRKHVVYNENEASRSGSGCRYIVDGEGASAKLLVDETAGMWISEINDLPK